MIKIQISDVLDKLDFDEEDKVAFEGSSFLEKPKYNREDKTFEMKLVVSKVLPYRVWDLFYARIRKYLGCKVKLYIESQDTQTDPTNLYNYVKHILAFSHMDAFRHKEPYIIEDVVVFYFEKELDRVNAENDIRHITDFLDCCGIDTKIECRQEVVKEVEEIKTVTVQASPVVKQEENNYRNQPKQNYFQRKPSIDKYIPFTIKEIDEPCDGVRIEGEIFQIENRTLRSEKLLQSLWISDYNDSIVMKRFERGAVTKEVLEEVSEGDYVIAYGKIEYDSFSHELVFMAEKIDRIKKEEREDNAKEKRVELHLHTKMSEMDGVSNIESYVKRANSFGWDAIAVTDHLVVQAFPKAQHAVAAINKNREKPFKMIYGIEMNLVDEKLSIVRNANDNLLDKQRYCVFDLETTGLSSRFDEIIEFGAQIIENQSIVKSFQTFVKPKKPLLDFTTNLTGITQEMVDSAPTFEEVAQDLIDFIGDSVLVAHNAAFDYSFINDALVEIGRAPLMNPVVDTLDLARSVRSHRKGYRLGQIAREYGVRYDEDVAHRADYDAEVLSGIFLGMLSELKDIKTLKDLQDLQDDRAFTKLRPKHVTLLAKNSDGLKEIFELVSLSHTKYLSYDITKTTGNVSGEPRIIKAEIEKRRNKGNILVGTSCVNGEVFDIAQTRNANDLEEAMKFYDYVEIQPIGNYMFLVERNSIQSVDRLKEILQAIVDAAQKLGKPLIASGDAHYVDPVEKKFRDIHISAQAIGGVRHPLYIYDAERRKRFIAPDQHLRTTEEMLKEYAWLGSDLAYEMVIKNPKKIVEQIDAVYPIKDKLYPPEMEGSDEKLREICYENAHKIYGEQLPEIVEARLKRELDSIIGAGFYVVYYISHLLVKKSLEDGYLVGSRGSVGSSFVATMSNITEVNPLAPHYICKQCQHSEFFTDGSVASGFDLPDKECPNCGTIMKGDGQDIPFETFLGFEGDKVPDIDLNFSGDYQPVAHAYTKEVFGEEYVYKAGTIGTVAVKTAFGYVKGYQEEMDLQPMRRAHELYLATGAEGVKRTTGQHPGGIIVIPDYMEVHDFTPVQYPANNPLSEWKTTHFEFHDIHDNVLKLDILGHVDPTAMRLLQEMSGIDPTSIPMNDPETMSLFSSLDALNIDSSSYLEKTGAVGLPEFGTQFVRGILEMTRPTTFDELVRISGLSHGTDVWLNNAKDLVEAGTSTLKEVIGCRDDIMVYLMHKGLEPKLAFTIMESVRKGKGLKEEWIPTMQQHNLEPWYIDSCEKIKYMFPKAHAVAYVMMAVRIAWFKVHQPLYYYCMFFSIRCDAYDIDTMIKGDAAIRQRMKELKIIIDDKSASKKDIDTYNSLELALEMVLRGYKIGNIDLYKSQASTFVVDKEIENTIVPPFASLDGLGENVAQTVVNAREEREFLSKEDLVKRTSLSTNLVKRLEQMGVLDGLQDEDQLSLF